MNMALIIAGVTLLAVLVTYTVTITLAYSKVVTDIAVIRTTIEERHTANRDELFRMREELTRNREELAGLRVTIEQLRFDLIQARSERRP